MKSPISLPLMTALVALGLVTAAWAQGADGAAAKEADARMQADVAARMQADKAKAATDAAALKANAMAADAARETPTKLAKIVSVKGVEFERSYFTLEAPTSPRGAVTVEVFGDGTCRYLRAGGGTEHKMAGERVKRFSELLAKTEWLTKEGATTPGIRDGDRFTAKVMRTLEEGTGKAVAFDSGAGEPYKGLRLFVFGVIRQEELYEKISAGNEEGLDELARYMSGGENKPPVEIDLGRFQEQLTKVVRDPLNREDKQVATAVRAMAYYKATGERKAVEALADDRSGRVREAVAETLADFGAAESVPVLKKMVHRTTRAAGLGLVRMGTQAVPAVVEIIETGKKPETDAEQVQMIRAYVDNWEKVPQPVDERVVAAVKKSLWAAQARKDGSEMRYHEKFLELVSKAGAKDGGGK